MTHEGRSLSIDVLDVSRFAELLGMTEQSLYARRSRDPDSLPPAIRIGRRLVWRRATVEDWLTGLEESQNRPRRRGPRPSPKPVNALEEQ